MSYGTMRDGGKLFSTRKAFPPTNSGAATINGAAIDRQGFESCELHHQCGAASGTPTSFTVDCKLQDSSTGSGGWNDVSGAALTQLTAGDSEARKEVNLIGVKRYIRLVETVAFSGGSSPAIPVAGEIVLAGAVETPVS